ncbi:hypothetical protein HU200_053323 [Digitaria exilis]|uniref:No apical meristem-associated C-terminal domain-containing protein n=1 Tax=Digitaria exilis TaxID=1010633 RepID=A0A835AMT0_9POAL|nr:hypothetical protein HU200_053323 [Digitaria exilis]
MSGDGRPPRPSASTSAAKKRRSTFVAPTRQPAPRPGGFVPGLDLAAGVDPGGIRPRQLPDTARAPGAFLARQLFEAPPPAPGLLSPLRHEGQHGSVFTGAGKKSQTPSISEPARLPSHQVERPSIEAAATASDNPRIPSTTSIQDDDEYFSPSSSMPFYDWSCTPTADTTLQDPMGSSQSYVAMLTQDPEVALEVVTQTPITDTGSSRGRGGNYNHTEDIQLCWSWIAITFDPRINLAQQSYDKTKGFPYLHCWMEVRHTEKFQTIYEGMKHTQGKRERKSTTPMQQAQQDDRAPSKRPPGRKHSKEKQSKKSGEDEYAAQFATFIQMKTEEHQKRGERWKAEKELEERKLLWDQEQKIMFCNMSDMDENQRAYVKAMRQQIVTAKEALAKAAGGGSTSEQGSGGDVEEAESGMRH